MGNRYFCIGYENEITDNRIGTALSAFVVTGSDRGQGVLGGALSQRFLPIEEHQGELALWCEEGSLYWPEVHP